MENSKKGRRREEEKFSVFSLDQAFIIACSLSLKQEKVKGLSVQCTCKKVHIGLDFSDNSYYMSEQVHF